MVAQRSRSRVLGLGVALLLLLALLPSSALAQAVSQAPAQFSGTLPSGSWAAFSFSYAGDYSKVGVFLNYSPSDDPADAGLANANAVILEAYRPYELPPRGKPYQQAGGTGGEKFWQLESDLAGTYVLIVRNGDSLRRPVTFTLTTVAPGTLSDPHLAPAGPALTLVSADMDATVSSLEGSTQTEVWGTPDQGQEEGATAAGTSQVGAVLSAGGGWAAYSFPYPGDSSNVAVLVNYSPVGSGNDVSRIIGTLVTVAAFKPGTQPASGLPMAYASGTDGQVVWRLSSTLGGTYVVVLSNWDALGRPVQYTLKTVAVQADDDLANDPAGPPLTFVSWSQ